MKLLKTNSRFNTPVSTPLSKESHKFGYDESSLPFPSSASSRKRVKISRIGNALYNLLIQSGVHFRNSENLHSYDVTDREAALRMLITDREIDLYQTAPQCIATALIVSEIARQANLQRAALKSPAGSPAEQAPVLDLIDEIADTLGHLCDYQKFYIDVPMAALAIFEINDHSEALFDKFGNCRNEVLRKLVSRISVVIGKGHVQTFEFVFDAKPARIASAVKNSCLFDFSVGTVPTFDRNFMEALAQYLKQQRQRALKLH